jgi:glycosyltransferase involved in cell wall biosynthesis
MKIAQVSPRYHPYIGGIETHVREISERLVEKGFELEILSCDPSGKLPKEEIINGVRVIRFKSWAPSEAYYFSRQLKKYLKKNSVRFDVVHAHSYHAFPALYAAQAKSRNMLVFTPHYLGRGQTFFRNALHFPYKFMAKKIFEISDKVICVSKYEKNLVMNKFNLREDKVAVIPNGINMDELSRYKWRPKFPYARITYSGRLERYQKNVDKLVQAFKILFNEYGVDAQLLIIGKGPYEEKLRRLIDRLHLQNLVVLKHSLPREQYLEEIATSNIFVLPSEYECYGIVAAEAIAMGVPTVVANSTALSEFVENGLAFGIGTPITSQRIASAVYEILTKPQKTKKCKIQDKILTWDEVVSQLEELYPKFQSSKE